MSDALSASARRASFSAKIPFVELITSDHVVLMYDKKDITNRQFPIEICDYIESHYKRDGKIEGFNVYKKR